MRQPWHVTILAMMLLAAAGPVRDTAELLRLGDAAFARADYEEADDYYRQAEGRATDPGLIAFNRASALYRLHRYPLAEQLFRQCLSDAVDSRRQWALFGLANCLVQQADERGADALREALAHYRESLRHGEPDAEFREDVANNVELARLLLLDAKPSREDRSQENQPENQDRTQRMAQDRNRKDARNDPGAMQRPDQQAQQGTQQQQPGQEGVPTQEQPSPGIGKLPPVPDKDRLVPLPPEVAAAHLKQASERVRQAARIHQDSRPDKPTGVLDR